MLKKCSKCLVDKQLSDFYSCKDGVQSVRGDCKVCCKEYFARYRATHKEFIKKLNKLYRDRPEVKVSKQEYHKKYSAEHYQKNKDHKRRYTLMWQRKEFKKNPSFKLLTRLRIRIYSLLKNTRHRKIQSTLNLLGCSADDLKKHLESKFEPGMSWGNYNLHGWHVDHIIPCAKFDLTKEEDLRRCFHYSNLQPMWATENWSKGARYEGKKNNVALNFAEQVQS